MASYAPLSSETFVDAMVSGLTLLEEFRWRIAFLGPKMKTAAYNVVARLTFEGQIKLLRLLFELRDGTSAQGSRAHTFALMVFFARDRQRSAIHPTQFAS